MAVSHPIRGKITLKDALKICQRDSTRPVRIESWDRTLVDHDDQDEPVEILFLVYSIAPHDYDDLHFEREIRWKVFVDGKNRAGG